MAKSKSAQYYATHPDSLKKKREYQRAYNRDPEQVEKRVELNRERRKRGIYGKGGPDISHTKDGGTTLESPSTNRARNGQQKGKSPRAKRTNTKK